MSFVGGHCLYHPSVLSLGEYARKVSEEPFVITDQGKPIAVLLPLENTDLETASLGSNPRFL
jgi:hypothetical protein